MIGKILLPVVLSSIALEKVKIIASTRFIAKRIIFKLLQLNNISREE